ncbi:uncharacterized protein LAESUDRAFT_765517, partial [Laetiporus sulphureus 93-53]
MPILPLSAPSAKSPFFLDAARHSIASMANTDTDALFPRFRLWLLRAAGFLCISQYLDIEAVVDDDGETEVMEEDDQPLSDFIEDGSVHSEDESSSVRARSPSDHEEGVLEKEIARYCVMHSRAPRAFPTDLDALESVRAPELTDPALWMVKTRPNCALRAFCLIFGALAPTAASITQSAGPSDPITQSA